MRLLLFAFFASTSLSAQVSEDAAWQTLDRGLKDVNPTKRIDTILAMSVISPQRRARGMVESMLKDNDSGVRQAACTALGEMNSRLSVAKLHEALDDNSPEVVFAAARALYTMHDRLGRQVLIAVLAGERPDASGLLANSVREAKLKLHDPKALVLLGVNSGAGFLGPFGMGVAIAERFMKDNQSSGKTVAALLLATDNSIESKAAIKAALDDKNWTVRAAAARVVALRDIKSLYPNVSALLKNKRDEVRFAAAAAIIRLKQPA